MQPIYEQTHASFKLGAGDKQYRKSLLLSFYLLILRSDLAKQEINLILGILLKEFSETKKLLETSFQPTAAPETLPPRWFLHSS
jgi:hypothetical protein